MRDKREIRIRLEGVAGDGSVEAYEFGVGCINAFLEELPPDHRDCYYVGRRHNCYVKRTKAGTTIAVVRPEEAA